MIIVSIVFALVASGLSIRLLIQLTSAIKKMNKSYECVKAYVKDVSTWVEKNSRLDTDITWYKAELEYLYRGNEDRVMKNFRWEDDLSEGFVDLYINIEDADDVILQDEYRANKSVVNIFALLFFNLLFIIPMYYFSYNLIK